MTEAEERMQKADAAAKTLVQLYADIGVLSVLVRAAPEEDSVRVVFSQTYQHQSRALLQRGSLLLVGREVRH